MRRPVERAGAGEALLQFERCIVTDRFQQDRANHIDSGRRHLIEPMNGPGQFWRNHEPIGKPSVDTLAQTLHHLDPDSDTGDIVISLVGMTIVCVKDNGPTFGAGKLEIEDLHRARQFANAQIDVVIARFQGIGDAKAPVRLRRTIQLSAMPCDCIVMVGAEMQVLAQFVAVDCSAKRSRPLDNAKR